MGLVGLVGLGDVLFQLALPAVLAVLLFAHSIVELCELDLIVTTSISESYSLQTTVSQKVFISEVNQLASKYANNFLSYLSFWSPGTRYYNLDISISFYDLAKFVDTDKARRKDANTGGAAASHEENA